ncbi:MAG: BLUF domain-containing protein [Pirellulaceae bacterium]
MTCQADDSKLMQLVYASAATVKFDDERLDSLLSRARHNNRFLNVTGVLLFKDQTFLQVLEGKASVLKTLYEKIEQDDRHTDVVQLIQEPIAERNFGTWSMGFVANSKEITRLPGFVDFFGNHQGATFLDLQNDSRRIRSVLEGFRRGRWRRSSRAKQALGEK